MAKKSDEVLKPEDALIRAAGKYLDSIGGKAIVGGPCCIIQMPGEEMFYMAVKILGHQPPEKRKRCECEGVGCDICRPQERV